MQPRSTKRSAALLACITACWTAFTGVSTARADEPDDDPVVAQLIVRVDPAVTSIAAVNAAASTSTVAVSIGNNSSYLVDLPAGVDVDATVATIEAMPGVDWAVPNVPLTAPELEADRMYAWRMYAWALGTPLPAESAYAPAAVSLAAAQRTASGAGVVVAVVDTGVQPDHAALAGSLVGGRDFVDDDNAPFETANGIDDDGDGRIDEGTGHGTHVAGVIHQVAPAAKIMPVRVLDDDGTGSLWAATEGMYWAGSHGAKVINASIGTHGSARPLRDAVAALTGQGVLVVAAAGNDGKDRPQYPAAAPEAIAVGSVGVGDVVSSFSNYGRWLDVVAPGENIHSTFAFPIGSYAMNSGTSMATPWVAGAAALLVSAKPDATPARVTTAIKAGAVSVNSVNPALSGNLGSGRLDIAASMRKI